MIRYISGEKIFFKPVSVDDASEKYLSWLNDYTVTLGLVTGRIPTSMDSLRNYLSQVIQSKNAVMFAIMDKGTEDHIGNIKLDNIDWISQTGELGILIGDKNYWGKGIGKESCNLLIKYAFTFLNLRKITLCAFNNNPSAVKLYEKIGFIHEGTLKKHFYTGGAYVDKHYYSLFNPNSPS